MGGLFLLPLMLQSPATKGLGAFDSGLATFPQAIGVVMMVQVGSRVYPRSGPRRLLMHRPRSASPRRRSPSSSSTSARTSGGSGASCSPRGCFFSFMLISLQTATFATIAPPTMGRASAISSAGRQVGASFGVALLATVLTSRLAAHDTSLAPGADSAAAIEAFHEAFIVAAVLTAIGAMAALLINDKDAAVSMGRRVVIEDDPIAAPVAARH